MRNSKWEWRRFKATELSSSKWCSLLKITPAKRRRNLNWILNFVYHWWSFSSVENLQKSPSSFLNRALNTSRFKNQKLDWIVSGKLSYVNLNPLLERMYEGLQSWIRSSQLATCEIIHISLRFHLRTILRIWLLARINGDEKLWTLKIGLYESRRWVEGGLGGGRSGC